MNDSAPHQRLAYLGPQGTYSHTALIRYFGSEQSGIPLATIEDVFACVDKGECDYAVVPVENSSEGSVTSTLDCFSQYPVHICGEIMLRIKQVLMANQQTSPDLIRRIVSHQQSLGQCRNWLEQHLPGIERVAVSSNAEAARIAAREAGTAAIGSKTAAEIYQLNILAQDIEDSKENTTRFLVISKKHVAAKTGQDKTSLLISTPNEPGALFRAIEPFKRHDVNLSKLESRPSGKEVWSYAFYIDVDGHKDDDNVSAALRDLQGPNIGVRVLGSYPVAGTVHREQEAGAVPVVLQDKKIVIIGLGLIGGSVARALADMGLASQLWAVGRREDAMQLARERGVISGYSTKLEDLCPDADLIVIAVPGLSVAPIMQGLAGLIKEDCVITDVASVKQSTLDAAMQAFGEIPPNLVPGHPIAGSEQSGFEAARSDLFVDRRVILTPLEKTSEEALALVVCLWNELGAEVLQMSVAKHDEVLAATSHLPHLLAFALVDTLSQQGTSEEIFRYAAGGFRDFTRIASSDPHMWRDIFLSNSKDIEQVLQAFETDLDKLKQALSVGDADSIMTVLERAKKSRDRFLNKGTRGS